MSDSTGNYLAAAQWFDINTSPGFIYTSSSSITVTNYLIIIVNHNQYFLGGATWQTSSSQAYWVGLTSDSTGRYLAASQESTTYYDGIVFTSTNG